MRVEELAAGLWRWTARHPSWTPASGGKDGWDENVASYYYEAPAPVDALVLVDPLVPSASDASDHFLSALDRDVERTGSALTILITNRHHTRSADLIHERYADNAEIWAPRGCLDMGCMPTEHYGSGDDLPGELTAHAIDGLDGPEMALYLPRHRALFLADAVLGAGDESVRVAPPSWATDDEIGQARYRLRFRSTLAELLSLDIDLLLVSHGEPVLRAGHAALVEALDSPAWGDED